MEGGRNEENQARLPEMAVAPPPQQCPRCDSFNTKFCYYNNYSLSQPRYFCKACRRYWTHGGTLRNVPVGGGCRKIKKAKATPSIRATQGFPPAARAQSFAGKVAAPPMNNSMFTGASILSSLAAMNSFPGNQGAAQVNLGGGGQFQPSPTHYFQPQPSFIPPAGSFNSWGQALINTGGASSSSSTPADAAAASAATTTSGFWSYNNQTGSSFSPNAHPGFNPNQ